MCVNQNKTSICSEGRCINRESSKARFHVEGTQTPWLRFLFLYLIVSNFFFILKNECVVETLNQNAECEFDYKIIV